jgi:hypothetical protein
VHTRAPGLSDVAWVSPRTALVTRPAQVGGREFWAAAVKVTPNTDSAGRCSRRTCYSPSSGWLSSQPRSS